MVTLKVNWSSSDFVTTRYDNRSRMGLYMTEKPYLPRQFFIRKRETPPRILAVAQRYIQGPGVMEDIGHYLSLLKITSAGLLASKRGHSAVGTKISYSLGNSGITAVPLIFGGECSLTEINSQVDAMSGVDISCIIATGGGKLIDAGRAIAFRLNIPTIIIPTIASTDAPCSALSAIYSETGILENIEFYPQHPAMVIVDTNIIVDAGERYLVSGMGDSLATWYEALVCHANPKTITATGGRPTLASYAIGEICAKTLYEFGEAAAVAVKEHRNDEAVEKIVEANTLLSGLGFENGGLALAHALGNSYPEIPIVHENFMHGEMVAMGLMTQLCLEKSNDLEKVASFFAQVGLPIHLGQILLSTKEQNNLDLLIEATLNKPIAYNMQIPVTHESLRKAILEAHDFGLGICKKIGDEAYRRLHR